MIDFFNFNTIITPYIISFVYIFGAVAVPFIVYYFFKKYKFEINNAKFRLYIFIIFIFLELFWRIFCEFFMVYFKIYLALS
ncbi:DUF4282 domain-containing protein [Halarcobacter anaerophilus]|jgi:hypothetical protein|uniref:Uncharacterized protein n=1 Tax=Halarcobacter anaerophilus TaxID=877500 RepID=A0A4Q0XWJ4_9BACT|nr:DUF4282 domain-containing membrane protein [Halarcobacter anaerophilus]RXJ61852.1 hypothetical protein CRV06_11755 [Halarcobacter anaerophilus]